MYGKTVRAARKKGGVTQSELGTRIGKSKQWVSEFAQGNIRLNMDIAVQLATALGVEPDIFLSKWSDNIGQKREGP